MVSGFRGGARNCLSLIWCFRRGCRGALPKPSAPSGEEKCRQPPEARPRSGRIFVALPGSPLQVRRAALPESGAIGGICSQCTPPAATIQIAATCGAQLSRLPSISFPLRAPSPREGEGGQSEGNPCNYCAGGVIRAQATMDGNNCSNFCPGRTQDSSISAQRKYIAPQSKAR